MSEVNKEILKNLDDRALDVLFAVRSQQHFVDLVENAAHNGLLYVASHVGKNAVVLDCPNIKEDKVSGDKVSGKSRIGKEVTAALGSNEFLEHFLAEAYIINGCGCTFEQAHRIEDAAERIAGQNFKKLLPFGQVFYFVNVTDCGKDFKKTLKHVEDDVDKFMNRPMEERTNILWYKITRNLPDALRHRFHMLPYARR